MQAAVIAIIIIVAIIAGIAYYSLMGPAPTPTPATPTPLPLQGQILKIGLVDPLSGANAPFGVHAKRGLEMAVEEINAAGGIRGHTFN